MMSLDHYLYLALNAFTLLGPLALSFDRKVAYWRSWHALFPAIAITAALFLAWDVWFTAQGVWGFNQAYLSGVALLGLPLGEWLFFFTVPYACLFIYSCVKAYFPRDPLQRAAPWVLRGLMVLLPVIALFYLDHLYTSITFLGTAALIALNLYVIKPRYLGHFLLGYLIALIPFAIVNGVLTALPVVWYNDLENLGLRLGTIPIEDTMYNIWLVLMNVNLYEWLCQRRLNQEGQAKETRQHA
jgi:lycopene cyclase domain-containing protein